MFPERQNPLDETGPAALVAGLVGGEVKGTEVPRRNAPCQVGQPGRIAVIVFDRKNAAAQAAEMPKGNAGRDLYALLVRPLLGSDGRQVTPVWAVSDPLG